MRLEGLDGNWISLTVLGYEFPEEDQGAFDSSNWLVIAGIVHRDGLRWTFQEPSLLVSEGLELGSWMLKVANRGIPTSHSDQEDGTFPDLWFTEPNLAFSVASGTDPLIGLRVHLSLESGPPIEAEAKGAGIYEYFMVLVMNADQLRRAAEDWRAELIPFPVRGSE